jgi:hypothetical protein
VFDASSAVLTEIHELQRLKIWDRGLADSVGPVLAADNGGSGLGSDEPRLPSFPFLFLCRLSNGIARHGA